MRIAIINLTGGGISGGYRKYLLHLLPKLASHGKVESVLCASPAQLKVNEWFPRIANVAFADCLPFQVIFHRDKALTATLDAFSPDVVFIPMERYFRYRDVPVVNMVRNMLPLVTIPNNTLWERIRNIVQKKIAGHAVKDAQRIIAVSNHVKEVIQREWGVAEDRIGVVYHGADRSDSAAVARPAAIPPEWDETYFFTAGSIDPYRGLEDIFKAASLLKAQGQEVRIVIAGDARRAMAAYRESLNAMVRALGIPSNICWAGNLPEREIAWCYQNCRAFIMSSRVEACPNTVLESLAHGCVSISADNPPMPEFYGDNGIYFRAGDERALTEAIRKVFRLGERERMGISARAREAAKRFSWDATVDRTLNELGTAIDLAKKRHR